MNYQCSFISLDQNNLPASLFLLNMRCVGTVCFDLIQKKITHNSVPVTADRCFFQCYKHILKQKLQRVLQDKDKGKRKMEDMRIESK